MHHPYFFDFFCSDHADGGFRLRSGLFFLLEFGDIVFGPLDGFCVCRQDGIHHSSKSGLSSNTGKYRKRNRTNHNVFDVIVGGTCLRPCKQPEDVLEKRYHGGAFGCWRQLCFKARRGTFGLFILSFQDNCKISAKDSMVFSKNSFFD